MFGANQGGLRLQAVLKVEEKGSDVNLGCHLLLDAFQNNFDVAAALSNDSDPVEPIQIGTQFCTQAGRSSLAREQPESGTVARLFIHPPP
jgi:hypothetical protein